MDIFSKRGLSEVVTTLIIVLISLVAIGIIALVVFNLINDRADEITLEGLTVRLNIEENSVKIFNYSDELGEEQFNMTVKVKRDSGGGSAEIDSIRIVISDGVNTQSEVFNITIGELEERTFNFKIRELNIEALKEKGVILAVPILKGEEGQEVTAKIASKYDFSTKSSSSVSTTLPGATGSSGGSSGGGGGGSSGGGSSGGGSSGGGSENQPLIITINSPQNTVYRTENISFNVSANLDIIYSNFSIDGGATNYSMDNSSKRHFNYIYYGLADGDYETVFYVFNLTGLNLAYRNFSINTTPLPDSVPPHFTTIPSSSSFTYGSYWSGVDFDADDDETFGSYSINDSRFTISTSGILNSSRILSAGIYLLNVTINDSLNNLNSTTYTLTVNKATPSINLTLNGISGNVTIDETNFIYLNVSLINGDDSAQLALYNDGVLINQGTSPRSNLTQFNSPGEFAITGIYSSSENYSLISQTYYVTVNDIDYENPLVTLLVENPSDPAVYSYLANYQFNSTVTDSSTISKVLFEFNGTNYTTTNVGNVYSYSFGTLGAGVYNYRWFANDSNGNRNSSMTGSYTINKASPSSAMSLAGTSPIVYGTTSDFSAVEINEGDSDLIYVLNRANQIYGAGTWTFNYSTTGGQNYSSGSVSEDLIVNKAVPQGTLTNKSSLNLDYGNVFNFTYSESNLGDADLSYIVYRGGLNVNSQAGTNVVLGAGSYNYVFNTTGGANYSANSSIGMFSLTINKNSSYVLSISGTTPITYGTVTDVSGNDCPSVLSCALDRANQIYGAGTWTFNYSTAGDENYSSSSVTKDIVINKAILSASLTNSTSWTVTYPTSVSVGLTESNSGDSDVSYLVYRNNLSKGTGETIVLGAGSYSYLLNSTGGANYSSSASLDNEVLIVNKATTSGDLINNSALSLTYGTVFNFTFSESNTGDGDVSYQVFRNGINVTSERGLNIVLGVGSYEYILNTTGGTNYSANSRIDNFTVVVGQAASSVQMFLNNSRTNLTITNTTTINFNATRVSGEGSIQILKDGVIFNSGSSPIFNSTAIATVGYYNFSAYYPSTQNYSASYETFFLNVTAAVVAGSDSFAPLLSFIGLTPTDGSTVSVDNFVVNVSSSEDSGDHSTFVDFNNSLVLWMRMDDTNGSMLIYDNSSYGNNGTIIGNAVYNSSGKFGGSFSFPGGTDYILLNSVSAPQNTTISLWFKKPVGSAEKHALRYGNPLISATDSVIKWFPNASSTRLDSSYTNNGDWIHFSVSQFDTNCTTYVNGAVVQNGVSCVPINDQTLAGRIGSATTYFNGSIDDVQVYSRALSSSEVLAIYNATANQYYNNFTNLANGNYSFKAYSQDVSGNVNSTERRIIRLNSSNEIVGEIASILLDITDNLTYLGRPSENQWGNSSTWDYARNIWDMIYYHGKVYFGFGNSANTAPDSNAGPITLVAYDLNTLSMENQTTINHEQIERFKIYETLYIPGHDPTVGLEGYYFLNGSTWTAKNLTSFHHVFDILRFNDSLMFVSVGTNDNPAKVSRDNGSTWTHLIFTSNDPVYTVNGMQSARTYSAFSFKNQTYFSGPNVVSKVNSSGDVIEQRYSHLSMYNGSTNAVQMPIATSENMFPPMKNELWYLRDWRVERPIEFNGSLVYLAGDGVNDQQWNPMGLFVLDEVGNEATEINLSSNVFDLIDRNGSVYALGYEETSSNYINKVFVTTNLTTWTELFRFNSSTFARSFELANGKFYFGMGTNTTNLSVDNGKVYSYNYQEVAPVCGNWINESGEQCDDGNLVNGDGCNNICEIEIDSTAPYFTNVFTTLNWVNNTALYYDVNATDETSFDSFSLNDTTYFTINSSSGVFENKSAVPAGTYNLNITINDSSNNLNSTIGTVVVTAPAVDAFASLLSFIGQTPTDGSTVSVDNFVVNVSSNLSGTHSTFLDFDKSLRGWWRMDDTNGSTLIYDNSSYGNNGTAVNGPVYNSSGKLGSAFSFDGSNDYISIGNWAFSSDATFSVWYKSSYTGAAQMVFGGDSGFFCYTYNASGGVQCSVDGSSSGNPGYSTNTHDGNWHHLVLTRSGDSNSLYIDGTSRASWSEASTTTSHQYAIGRYHRVAVGTYYSFNGSIDDVMIFNRSLSSGEVLSLYNSSANPYYRNFTSLPNGNYSFKAYAQNSSGYVNSTETSVINVSVIVEIEPVSNSIDYTDSMIYIGDPTNERYGTSTSYHYARNIWDMEVFKDKLFFGYGSSATTGPNGNAGPINVTYYNFTTGQIHVEDSVDYNSTTSQYFTVKAFPSEQIEKLLLIDDKLYVTNHDPRVSTPTYMYRNETGWTGKQAFSITHNFDMARYNGSLFLAYSSGVNGYFRVSTNNGSTWTLMTVTNGNGDDYGYYYFYRPYTLFVVNNTLYGSGYIYTQRSDVDGSNRQFVSHLKYVGGTTMQIMNYSVSQAAFPGVFDQMTSSGNYGHRQERTVLFNNKMVYIGVKGVNDQQWDPKGIFYADDVGSNVQTITLNQSAKPWDIKVHQGKVYVLGEVYVNSTKRVITISESSDLSTWNEIARVNYTTFARSFAFYGNDIFLGMGTNESSLSLDAGNIFVLKDILNSSISLDSIGNKNLARYQSLDIDLNATNNISAVSFYATNLPGGATLDSSSGLFSWSPNITQNGTYTIGFSVSDGNSTDYEVINVTVTSDSTDVTNGLEYIGTPSDARYGTSTNYNYARNIWDMIVYDGRVYTGFGNAANADPNRNAGPLNITSYNLTTGEFLNESYFDGEQIDQFRIINGTLYVPNMDPRASQKRIYYSSSGSGWTLKTISTDFTHVYDMGILGGDIILASHNDVIASEDGGTTWNYATWTTVNGWFAGRAYTYFEFQNQSYASGQMWDAYNSTARHGHLMRYNGSGGASAANSEAGRGMFPGVELGEGWVAGATEVRVERPIEFNGSLVYIAAKGINDHQWDSKGLFYSTNLTDGYLINFSGSALPMDIIENNGSVYVLGYNLINSTHYVNILARSENLLTWEEVLRFNSTTFARSFEILDGEYYFGMGTNTTSMSNESGKIYHI